MLSIWQVSMLKLWYSTSTQPENWRQVFRGKQESAPRAVPWKMMIAFITIKSSLVPLIEGLCAVLLWLLEISSLTPWTAMAVSSCERINRYCTINPCSFCARLFPEPWLRWEKSSPSTSRISSSRASLLTDSQCGLTPIHPRVWLHRRMCVVNHVWNACLRVILWRSVYHSVSCWMRKSVHTIKSR